MKKVVVFLVLLLSLFGQSFAQLAPALKYDQENYFFTRNSGESISFELLAMMVCLGILMFLIYLAKENENISSSKESIGKVSLFHFLPNLAYLVAVIVYSNFLANNFYLWLCSLIGIIILVISSAVNTHHLWNQTRYLIMQWLNLLVVLAITWATTQSLIAVLVVLIPPMFIFSMVLYATEIR